MRVLVSGGAGFIGRAVINELIPAAERIVALDSLRPDVHRDDGASARQRLAVLGVELLTGDLRDGAVVAKSLRGVDAVVHLGAKVGLGVGIDDMDDYVSKQRPRDRRPASRHCRCRDRAVRPGKLDGRVWRGLLHV